MVERERRLQLREVEVGYREWAIHERPPTHPRDESIEAS